MEGNPTTIMIDQLLRTVTYVGIEATIWCAVASCFIGAGWIVWRAVHR